MANSEGSIDNSHPLTRAPNLTLVANTPKGRGVFASALIPKGTVIDISPVLILPEEDLKYTSQTIFQHYTYYWPVATNSGKTLTQALALGLGSMFNHSTLRQNVTWQRDLKAECIIYISHRDIQPGEELCISYGNARLWFEDADAADADDDYARIREQSEKLSNGDSIDSTIAELNLSGLGGIAIDVDDEELKYAAV